MNKSELIQSFQEATQRAVGEGGYKIEVVYSRLADAAMGLHSAFVKNHVRPLVSESVMKELLPVDFVTLPKCFVPVIFTAKGKTYMGIYKGAPIDLFIEEKAKWMKVKTQLDAEK